MVSDTSLLTQLQAGDEASFEAIFLKHYDRIYGVLYRLLGNRADAEDIAQQVFLKLYHAPQRIQVRSEEDTNLIGWLYRVATNEGYNALRSRKRRQGWYQKFFQQWDSRPPDPASVVESQDDQARVRQILAEMKPRQAKLLLLRHSGLAYKEIASALNVAPGSVGSLLTRAERSFRQKYQQAFPALASQQGDGDYHDQKN